MTDLLQLRPAELAERLGGPGRARAVYALLRKGGDPFAEGALPPKARARLLAAAEPTVADVAETSCAEDGTTKLLIRLADGRAVETVLIPEARRTTLCVSSQVGCARGCIFCATATMKLARNLTAAEICAQVVLAIGLARSRALPPLRNLVFMGMGEPLDNLVEVHRALDLVTASSSIGLGFGPGHVTVSTVGPSPEAILRARPLPGRLAWSLHAAEDEVRRRLVPTQKGSVADLARAFSEVVAARGEPLFVEMTLIDGLNDGPDHAARAAALFAGFAGEVRFNLLPMNAVAGAEHLRASPTDRVERFAALLKKSGHFTMIRKARGAGERAACGQLVTLHMKPAPSPHA